MRHEPVVKAGPTTQVSWPKVVLKKWLNIKTTSFNYDEGENDSDIDDYGENICGCEDDEYNQEEGPKLRRRNSETLRTQYIKNKELRIEIGTWNVGGMPPPDELNIQEWLNMEENADIYVFGMQEIVPLNAGNVFGAEDRQRVPKWESLIRDAINRIQPVKPKYKCHSNPSSPSRYNPRDDAAVAVNDILSEDDTDTDEDEELSSWDSDHIEQSQIDVAQNSLNSKEGEQKKHFLGKRFDRLHRLSLVDYAADSEVPAVLEKKLLKTLTVSERIGLVWPEQPLDLIIKHTLEEPNSFKSTKPFRKSNSFKPACNDGENSSTIGLLPELDLSFMRRQSKRRAFVRIVSKQMIGIYLSIWVRRGLRRHIQNLTVSSVGVGAMGYIGNKGSIAVSMSIYQTLVCFVCSHLSSGEKSGDELKRNADVQEIHHKTQFITAGKMGSPKTIYDHERVFWLGDLNYRIDLPYNKIHEMISRKEWSLLAESDQQKRELKKGRAFDGWSEGVVKFPPTYKYEFNSTKYIKDDNKGGRRRPAWCDRILFLGKGMKLVNYGRSELDLSDHRPVRASLMVEVEEFCHRKLQKALTLTDAEVKGEEAIWRL